MCCWSGVRGRLSKPISAPWIIKQQISVELMLVGRCYPIGKQHMELVRNPVFLETKIIYCPSTGTFREITILTKDKKQ